MPTDGKRAAEREQDERAHEQRGARCSCGRGQAPVGSEHDQRRHHGEGWLEAGGGDDQRTRTGVPGGGPFLPRSRQATAARMQTTAGMSLWKPPMPMASVTGHRPAQASARCGERPSRRASHHTSASADSAEPTTTSFQHQ